MGFWHWLWLASFMAGILSAALYGLTASGHFPAERREQKFRETQGALVLWSTLLVTLLSVGAMLVLAWRALPWYIALLGGGAMLLFAPMLLQPLPDSFVNGRRGLLAFCACAVAFTGLMWLGT